MSSQLSRRAQSIPCFLVLTLGVVLFASPASAQLVALECPGTIAATYNPGIKLEAQAISATAMGSFGPCVGVPLTLPSGTFTATGGGTLSCVTGDSTFDAVINWNDNSTSNASVTATIDVRPGGAVVVYTGTLSSGKFNGATIVITVALLTTDLDNCLTAQGVTFTSGAGTITFAKVL
ncbi:hypothetical protein HUA74_42350 [Myxococcus sp. CA051A]|uniref:hypothetical protein n=1 Tax=unclassified Myxococcus TaxID=2648731 RepID=UPI00157B7F86|nr:MULTISPECIES: hypothetical protein [unclassified Myxococcus]NTX40953.1 hypothetical protein [Myxococcus sp. CA033]NTX54546.1 hypothetical protein [Myxococcus sp. CA039A]NTX67312.1 hypothetical protein [Myxococcus sp. CA051A]